MKKLFFLFFTLNTILFSQNYQIKNYEYNIDGITKEEYLSNKITINTTDVFDSEEELIQYINELKQKYINLRLFDTVDISHSLINIDSDEKNTNFVSLLIQLNESKNFILLPYYKYDSTDGNVLKAKLKNSNFLGTLEELESEFSFGIKSNDSNNLDFKLGGEFLYNLPFFIGPIKAFWNNDLGISYTIGKDIPEWNANTGFTFSLPFEKFSIDLTLTQKFVNDFDYKIYDDSIYFGEEVDFSVPIKITNTNYLGKFIYTPEINFIYNWQPNEKINICNDDLLSPELSFINNFSLGQINWHNNFRKGTSIIAKQITGYNFLINKMILGYEIKAENYLSNDRIGFNSRLISYYYMNKNKKIGEYLRGIRDDEYFNPNVSLNNINSTSTPMALILNLDLPIRIITTDFEKWGFKFLRKLNFELQINPFIDFALTHNRVTERTFSLKDGFYTAGIEFIVFPLRWKSLQIRACAGFDLGRMFFKDFIDSSWRPNPSVYEVSFGIGLHY